MNELIIVLSQFKEAYMWLMQYLSIREETFQDFAKKYTWKLLHAYIDAHIQILIDEYPWGGAQVILILK